MANKFLGSNKGFSKLDEKFRRSIEMRCSAALDGDFVDSLTIENLIDDPVGCGYLLRFCIRQFSAENLNFVIEVNRFREVFSNLQNHIEVDEWNCSYTELDKRVADGSIPTEQLNRSLIDLIQDKQKGESHVKWSMFHKFCAEIKKREHAIWDTFISDEAETQICLSTEVLANTRLRRSQIAVYGPDVFTEACLDPIKTLRRDILPRFKKSDIFQTMSQRKLQMTQLPPASALVVPAPALGLEALDESKDFTVTRRFSLEEMLVFGPLYLEFLEFLQRRVCSECLLCSRLIAVYEEHMRVMDYSVGNELAWTVYMFFIAPGAAFEIFSATTERNDILRHLAKPHQDLFRDLKQQTSIMLQSQFASYTSTPEYKNLGVFLLEKKQQATLTLDPAENNKIVFATRIAKFVFKAKRSNKIARVACGTDDA